MAVISYTIPVSLGKTAIASYKSHFLYKDLSAYGSKVSFEY